MENNHQNGVSSEDSQLAEDLAHFNNVKNEFLIFGRLASYGLFRQGHLEESKNVCSKVLAIEPADYEMKELEGKIEKLQSITNSNQLIKKDLLLETTESPIRKIRRSISEHRKVKPFSMDNNNAADFVANGHGENKIPNAMNGSSSEFSTNGHSSSSKANSSGTPKVARSLSENSKRSKSTSILEKIQFYDSVKDTVDRNSLPNTSIRRKASIKPNESVIVESPPLSDQKTPEAVGFLIPPDQIKQEVITPPCKPPPVQNDDKLPSASSEGKIFIIENVVEPEPAQPVMKSMKNDTPTDTPTRKLSRQFGSTNLIHGNSNQAAENDAIPKATKLRTDSKCSWTDSGLKEFPKEILANLESEYFNSQLITKACILSANGDILGLTAGFRIKQYEIQTLISGMADATFLTSSKLTIGSIQYSCLSGTDSVVRARIGKLGINCTKCKDCNNIILITVYEHPVLPKPIALLVKNIQNYLAEVFKDIV